MLYVFLLMRMMVEAVGGYDTRIIKGNESFFSRIQTMSQAKFIQDARDQIIHLDPQTCSSLY